MNQSDYENLSTLSSMLDEMYVHFHAENPSHRFETNEGQISFLFGTVWDREVDSKNVPVKAVTIISSAFASPSYQFFDSLDEALETVSKWYMGFFIGSTGATHIEVEDEENFSA